MVGRVRSVEDQYMLSSLVHKPSEQALLLGIESLRRLQGPSPRAYQDKELTNNERMGDCVYGKGGTHSCNHALATSRTIELLPSLKIMVSPEEGS